MVPRRPARAHFDCNVPDRLKPPGWKRLIRVLALLLATGFGTSSSVLAQEPDADSAAPQILDDVIGCLRNGSEAVLEAGGVTCKPYREGVAYLDREVPAPERIDHVSICRTSAADRRVLGRRFLKNVISRSKGTLDPTGIRLVGGIYCSGIDLVGLDIPFSLVLDRSVVAGDVELRNFRTGGDLSVDNTVIYGTMRLVRSDIAGSVYTQYAYINNLGIEDTTIRGSFKSNHSVIGYSLNFENVNLSGDVDLAFGYFSSIAVLKSHISGLLDLGQTQARCAYDIRKNDFEDVIAADFGFGRTQVRNGRAEYAFTPLKLDPAQSRNRIDAYERFSDPRSTTRYLLDLQPCEISRSISPGTFVLVDNRIKASLCVRSPRWLTGGNGEQAKSNFYFNEDTIEGAAWLDLNTAALEPRAVQDAFKMGIRAHSPANSSAAGTPHLLSLFNMRTGTLILNFSPDPPLMRVAVNGLSFDRVYTSNARCESALSLRATLFKNNDREIAKSTPSFPPDLNLPRVEQVLDWINLNTFQGTQPFAQFVSAFEKAGNLEGARDLRVQAARASLKKSARDVFCWWCAEGSHSAAASSSERTFERAHNATSALPGQDSPPEDSIPSPASAVHGPREVSTTASAHGVPAGATWWSEIASGTVRLLLWLEKAVVTALNFMLWILVDNGYRPERIGWYVLGTVATSLLVFLFWIRVVGFSVVDGGNKIHSIGPVFLFDHMLPAYRIREQNYKIDRYFVHKRGSEGPIVKHLGMRWPVIEANAQQTRRAERVLDILRFAGLVFAVFVLAAVGKLVH